MNPTKDARRDTALSVQFRLLRLYLWRFILRTLPDASEEVSFSPHRFRDRETTGMEARKSDEKCGEEVVRAGGAVGERGFLRNCAWRADSAEGADD